MGQVLRRPIDHPSAWKAADFAGPDDYAIDLGPRHIAAFDEALAAIRARGLGLGQVEREHFEVPAIAGELADLRDLLVNGRGFALLRGFPVKRYSQEEIEIVFWGIGTHIGIGQSQSVLGDRLGHVIDATKQDPHARAYRNRMELTLHTDLCDVVALLSLQKSPVGGMSVLTSAIAVYNEIVASHPEYLEPLFQGAPVHRMNEEKPGQTPYTPHDVPPLSVRDGVLSCRYIRELLDAGADAAGRPLSAFQRAAFDCFDATAARRDLSLRFVLEPGEAIFFNNWTTLHGRTAFEDGDRPDQKRHLLRLWLDVPGARPVVPETAIFEGSGIGFQRGKTPTVDLDRYLRTIDRPQAS
jgi:alpha-ketoglutarate-dependent taurine dioxygenase